MMFNDGRNYPFALSIDMRVFNNQEADYGVEKFIERLGFTPDYVFNHETYVGQIHSHNGLLDDTMLLPTWVAQRAIPGCQLWTRKQYKECVDVLHANGVKFFQGAEAAWSQWPEYGEISKDTWIHEHIPEMFTTYRNGNTTKNEMGMICPLKRMKDGAWYEDFLLKDVLRYLEDYNMDGFFAADGFGGLATQLVDGDYSEDMIAQFTEKTGSQVKGSDIPEKAAYIWENLRYEWISFYADRWASFYSKTTKGFRDHNKDLIVMAPFKHGPADALYKYGYYYERNAAAGLDFYALESMETNSHRWQNMQSMAATGISNVTTIKAIAPDTRIMWMSAACNTPEHWHTLRDHPAMLERECISLNTARAIGPQGESVKGFTGVQPLFGIDLNASEWRWYKQRLDIGHMNIVHNEGLVNIWSNEILYENTKRLLVYPYTFETVRLRFSGLPVHCTVDIKNVTKVKNKSLLLIQPLGINDHDVVILKNLVEKEGKILIVAGEVENANLLKLLGLEKNNNSGKEWSYAENDMMDLYRIPENSGAFGDHWGGYSVGKAKSVVNIFDGGKVTGTGLSVNAAGHGYAVFIRVIRKEFPKMNYRLTDFHVQSHPRSLPGVQDGFLTIKDVTKALAEMHPGSYELICARLVQLLDGTFPYSDKGQVLACTARDGKQYLFVENPLNLQYIYMTVTLPKEKKYVMELGVRKNGPMGYQYYGDNRPKNIDVCIPPEALIPFRIDYKD
jgi:hypothetical protein